jgi:hypothetical protein
LALHSGIDTVAFVSEGAYTETYGSLDPGNIANLFASDGMMEDLPLLTAILRRLKGLLLRVYP